MMFYIYTILIPGLILGANYILSPKPKKNNDFVNLVFKMIPHLWGYTFFMYFLEAESYINTSWVFYTMVFYMIPITMIVGLLKIFYFIKK